MDLLDSLTVSQRETLQEFQTITNTDDLENGINALNGSGWDLQTALSSLYDAPAPSSSRQPLLDEFDIDDSEVMPRANGSNGVRGANGGGITYWLRGLIGLPISVLVGSVSWVVGMLARFLNVRAPTIGTLRLHLRNPFSFTHSRPRLSPHSSAERFVRSVEELTGGIRYSRRHDPLPSVSSSSASTSEEGLRRRNGGEGRLVLPDFEISSYDDAVKKSKEQLKVLMIVLSCEEHDEDEGFKQGVLGDRELAETLRREGVLIWGGDVRDRDAFQVGKLVGYHSLPFIAFISLTPPTPGSSSSSKPTIITRLEPPSTLSPTTVVTTLTTSILPRTLPYLNRLRAQKEARDGERKLREEMERRYREAEKRDGEKIKAMRENKMKEEREKREKEELEKAKERERELMRAWREKTRSGFEGSEPKEGVRVGIRLGDGRRIVRKFGKEESVGKVYEFVECSLSPPTPPSPSIALPPNFVPTFHFHLSQTFPHSPIPLSTKSVGEMGLEDGSNIVVEGLERRRMSLGERPDDEDEEEEEEEEGEEE